MILTRTVGCKFHFLEDMSRLVSTKQCHAVKTLFVWISMQSYILQTDAKFKTLKVHLH